MIQDCTIMSPSNRKMNSNVEPNQNEQNQKMQQMQHHYLYDNLRLPDQYMTVHNTNNINGQMPVMHNNFLMAVDESEPRSSTNEITSDGVIDITNTSDIATVEDSNNEIPNPEDRFTYLEGLDSGNLMQFSQQSALQELMKNEYLLDVKSDNLNILPTFEEHDIGGYKFQVNINNQRKGRSNWVYSETLNKVYIRMNDICNVEASYTPKLPVQQLRIRVLLCFVKEVSEPILRCQNHMSVDTESKSIVRRSLLRCENPSAEYCGDPQGKNINDRLSILIPLNSSVKQGVDDNIQKQTIALKFTCQNSCIGRKETSVIFLLESLNGEILSQRVVDVKMCSCPKRDKSMDERNLTTKRKIEEEVDPYPRKKKIIKRETRSSFSSLAETSRDTTESDLDDLDFSSDHSNSLNFQKDCDFDFQSTVSGRWRLVLEGRNRTNALPFLEFIFRQMGLLAFQASNNPMSYRYYTRQYRKAQKTYEKLSKSINY